MFHHCLFKTDMITMLFQYTVYVCFRCCFNGCSILRLRPLASWGSAIEVWHLLLLFLIRKFPELFRWFKDFLGYKESGMIEPVPQAATGKERISGELAMEIGVWSFSIGLHRVYYLHDVVFRLYLTCTTFLVIYNKIVWINKFMDFEVEQIVRTAVSCHPFSAPRL